MVLRIFNILKGPGLNVFLLTLFFAASVCASTLDDRLTRKEKQWLADHPVIRVGVGVAFPPFMWVEAKGEKRVFKGLVADYLDLLSKRLGVEMEILFDISFKEALKKAQKGEIDFFPCISNTPERSEFLNFSDPYIGYPLVLITREGTQDINELEDLSGRRLATVKHLAVFSKLENDYKGLGARYVATQRVDENLEAVSLGVADACIINLAAASYYIQQKGLTNLRVATSLEWKGLSLSMGVRKDWPVFLGIIQKALNSITPDQRELLSEKWVHLEYTPGIDILVIVKWALGAGIAVSLLFGFIFAWNRRLKKVIAEKERAETALRMSRRNLSNLMGNLPGVVYQCLDDENWTMTYLSDGCRELTGYEPGDLISNTKVSFNDLILERDRDRVAAEVESALEKGSTFTIEYRIKSRDNREKWIWEKGRATGDNRKGVAVLEGFLQDISSRKMAETDLLESRQSLLEAQRMSSTGSWQWDADTDRVTCSGEMLKIFGLDETTPVLDPEIVLARIHENDITRVRNLLERSLKGEPGFEIQFRIRDENKGTRYIQGIGRVGFDEEKRPILIRGSNQDITSRVQAELEKEALESQLRHAHKMEAVGTLAGGIAHEFNNILSIILGNAELAMENTPDSDDSLEEICNASLRGRDVVKQLLSFSRIDEPPAKQPLDLGGVIHEAVGFLRAYIPSHVQFNTNIDPDCRTILADPTQMHQLIINLCNNAAQSMADGGTINIVLENVSVTARRIFTDQVLVPGEYLKLRVSDRGCGIEPGELKKVFHPFYTTKEVDQGSGMGLAVVYGIVRDHKGFISIESRWGEGTSIDCFFPPSMEKAAPAAVVNENGGLLMGDESVIFVDDETSLVMTGKKRLERLGYRVAAFSDPEEALNVFAADPEGFDLVITDYTMPQMNGDKLIQLIKTIREDLPCIISSGYAEKINSQTPSEMGADAYMMKPVDLKKLSRTIRKVLD